MIPNCKTVIETLRRFLAFIDPPLDLSDLLGDGNLFGTDLGAFPEGLAAPGPILVIQQSDPLRGRFIP